MDITIIFPHQLFAKPQAAAKSRAVFIVEDVLFFSHYPFHKQKIVLHRASLQAYKHYLEKKGYEVSYISASEKQDLSSLFTKWKKSGVSSIHYTDTVDYLLERRLNRFASREDITLKKYDTTGFLTTPVQIDELFAKEKRYLMANFYIKQRKRLDILVEDGEPIGGKWSFDTENRMKLPKGLKLPLPLALAENKWVTEAKHYVDLNFRHHPGELDSFNYPVTFGEAEKVLEDFLLHRMKDFGTYEDAIIKEDSVLFHSIITPALNIGLLTPQQIIDKTLELHRSEKFPLNSLEGFVRQVIGWREFMRAMYIREGVYMRKQNHWRFERKIPSSFYNGTTGIEPIDNVIRKVLRTGYCHHIERLMVLGNFMQLCEFHPDAVYRWFMELFIDSYDWVMVPNVYAMSQYAAGGLMTTKPYVSGSNYILKMSNYGKGDWCAVWDALYWRYIHLHQNEFARNPRMSMITNLVNKMDQKKLAVHLKTAELFLSKI